MLTFAQIRYYLHNMDDLRHDIADLEADIAQYKAMLSDDVSVYKPSGLNGVKVQLITQDSHVEKIAIIEAEKRTDMERLLQKYKDILASIQWVVRRLTEVEREIYRMKYIEKRNMKKISVQVGFCVRRAGYIDAGIVRSIQLHFRNLQKKRGG